MIFCTLKEKKVYLFQIHLKIKMSQFLNVAYSIVNNVVFKIKNLNYSKVD